MNEHRNCTCPASKSGSFQIATDHYSRNFIPTGWKLEYTSLEQHEPQRFLYMTGWCLRCGGQDLQSGISIPDELSGDALLERIYREMEHYRPFEHRRSDGTYNRSLLGRAAWYMEQDDLTLGRKKRPVPQAVPRGGSARSRGLDLPQSGLRTLYRSPAGPEKHAAVCRAGPGQGQRRSEGDRAHLGLLSPQQK